MKKYLIPVFLSVAALKISAQQMMTVKNGESVIIQNGVELTLQGGITLENGSSLLNNGTVRLKNNSVANLSDWIDNSSAGALNGNGWVIFNSTNSQNFSGATNFYAVQINGGGLVINSNFSVSNLLNLINGKINTGSFYVFLNNNDASSLINDVTNPGYSQSWINGNFRRSITGNASIYDFPVGNSTRSNLLQFLNNNVTGANHLTASFGPKPGSDAGMNVIENSAAYTAINNGGVWWLIPDAEPSAGSYALQLYFNGFTGLVDNQFGILRRADASTNATDWIVPVGSLLESTNGLGRKVSDGFARRFNISGFSQWGIGMTGNILCENCTVACSYTQGFYGNKKGKACYNNDGSLINSDQLMLNAFGADASQVFGSLSTNRYFTLFKTDISNGNIYKMLPGSGNSQLLGMAAGGATYGIESTWPLVPILNKGPKREKINNQLLSQLISLWFNIRNSSTLADIDLSMDTLVTTAQTSCGSGVLSGSPAKFGLPHSVIVYLNGGNGYTSNVNGLFLLANDVLGGANSAIDPNEIQNAVETINSAFDGCRMLVRTIPFSDDGPVRLNNITLKSIKETNKKLHGADALTVYVYPNPASSYFNIVINGNDAKEKIVMQVVDMYGRVIETSHVSANSITRFGDRYRLGTYFVRITKGKEHKEITLIKLSD